MTTPIDYKTSPIGLPSGQQIVLHWYVTDDQGLPNPPSGYAKQSGPYTLTDLEEAFYEGIACGVHDCRNLSPNQTYSLPDGSTIELDRLGNHTLKDDNAKVIYHSNNMREFNEYLLASDILTKFLHLDPNKIHSRDSGLVGFVNYLIEQAAISDGVPVPPRLTKIAP